MLRSDLDLVSGETQSCDAVALKDCPRVVRWSRRGQPWSEAEDRRLEELAREALSRYPGASMFSYKPPCPAHDVARALGRTAGGVQARWQALQIAARRRPQKG